MCIIHREPDDRSIFNKQQTQQQQQPDATHLCLPTYGVSLGTLLSCRVILIRAIGI